jgi:hypothetical protein
MISLSDLEQCIKLMAKTVAKITPRTNFVPF